MKKLAFTMLIALFSVAAIAQISVREKTEKIIAVPTFDSLTNIESFYDQAMIHSYKQYVGQTLYFKPYSQDKISQYMEDDNLEIHSFYPLECLLSNNDTTLVVEPIQKFEDTPVQVALGRSMEGIRVSKAGKANYEQLVNKARGEYQAEHRFITNIYKPKILAFRGVDYHTIIGSDIDQLQGKEFKIIGVQGNPENLFVEFALLDQAGCTLNFQFNTGPFELSDLPFIIVGTHKKQSEIYKGKTMIYTKEQQRAYGGVTSFSRVNGIAVAANSQSFVPNSKRKGKITTLYNENFTPDDLSKWECVEVSLVDDGRLYYNMYYILKNTHSGQEIKVPINQLNNMGFIDEKEYQADIEHK